MLSSNSGSRVRLWSLKKAGISTSGWYSSLGRWRLVPEVEDGPFCHLNLHTVVRQTDLSVCVMLAMNQHSCMKGSVDEPLISHNLCLLFMILAVRLGFLTTLFGFQVS